MAIILDITLRDFIFIVDDTETNSKRASKDCVASCYTRICIKGLFALPSANKPSYRQNSVT